MNRFRLLVILGAAFFASCVGNFNKRSADLPVIMQVPEIIAAPREYTIIDHENRSSGTAMPEWVSLWLSSGLRGIETLSYYEGRFVFVHRSEGNNFNALTLWKDSFSPVFDFPRLAAARIEARFSVPVPDQEYGAFFENLIRTASDAIWTGAAIEDDFWIHRKFILDEDEPESSTGAANQTQSETDQAPADFSRVEENWEYFILVSMNKALFASQLDAIFRNVNPSPRPTMEQTSAANRVKDRFFEGF